MTYEYVPGYPGHTSGPNGPITRIVIHATCSATVDGGAEANARYFQSAKAGGLAHYVVDPHKVVSCCHEDTACWHAPPNHGSIGIELTDPQAGAGGRWKDSAHDAMLHVAARLVLDVAARNHVPLTRLSSADLAAGKHGICGHVDVSQAFHQSTHTDPGPDFPWTYFMALLHTPPPAAHPAPTKPAAHPATAAPYHYPRTLSEGDRGPDVLHAQQRLGIHADGEFGPHTKAAVEAFQHAHHLTVDGVIGPETQRALG